MTTPNLSPEVAEAVWYARSLREAFDRNPTFGLRSDEKRIVDLAAEVERLSALVGGSGGMAELPEGCPTFYRYHTQMGPHQLDCHGGSCAEAGCAEVEIHPVGTRQRLEATPGAWQPMHLAPRNGTRVLISVKPDGDGYQWGVRIAAAWDALDEFRTDDEVTFPDQRLHGWMPLPTTPDKGLES